MKSNQPSVSPFLVIFLGILAVSTASIFIRYAQNEAPSLVIAASRLSISALILLPVALITKKNELRKLRLNQLLLAGLSGFFLAIHFATWIKSLEHTTVASSVVLVSTMPLWVALIAPHTLKEKATSWVVAGMLISLGGSLLVGLSDSCDWGVAGPVCPHLYDFVRGEAFWGDILALIGAIMGASYLLIGRQLRADISLTAYIFLVYGMAAIVLVIFMVVAGYSPFGYSPKIYLWFLLLALIPQLFGHSSFNWALGYLPAAYVSITLLGEPIGSTILAYLILDERPGALKIFGAILILLGILLASKREVKDG